MDYLFVAEKVMAEIEAKIVAQGDKIRELKTAKAAKDVIQPEVNSCHKSLHHCYVHCPMSKRKNLSDLCYICPRGTREGMPYFFFEKSVFVKHTSVQCRLLPILSPCSGINLNTN